MMFEDGPIVSITRITVPATKISDVTKLHQTVMSHFPKIKTSYRARQTMGVLFQITDLSVDTAGLLIASSVLPQNNLRAEAATVELEFHEGDMVSFVLDANITKRLPTEQTPGRASKHGRLVPLTTPAEQREWLDRKGLQHGFQVMKATFGPAPLPVRKGQHGIVVRAVRVQAEVEITDPELFTEAVTDGIGRGRAFGCGLVNVFEAV